MIDSSFAVKLCVQETVTESTCTALKRVDSPVACERVIDSSECAIKLAEGKADFAVFNAEELLLARQFYPNGVQVVLELRHEARANCELRRRSYASK